MFERKGETRNKTNRLATSGISMFASCNAAPQQGHTSRPYPEQARRPVFSLSAFITFPRLASIPVGSKLHETLNNYQIGSHVKLE